MILNRVDSFFTEDQLRSINDMAASGWSFQISEERNTCENKLPFLYLELDRDFIEEELDPLLKKTLDVDFRIERAYLNGQWNGRDGNFHTDDDSEDALTVLVYLNSEYDLEWGGFTQFIDLEKGISVVETPQFNRALVFKGNNLHKSYAFCYQNCPMRVTLAIKLTQL